MSESGRGQSKITIWIESVGYQMNCLLIYYCWFLQKMLYPLAFCPNDGSFFGCGCLNLSTVMVVLVLRPLNARDYSVFFTKKLPLHRAPVIESFSLDLTSSNFKPDQIKLWVVIAIFHCVRELEIIYAYDRRKRDILPSNLYTCKSLVILKLNGEFLLDVPRVVFLPSLKTLKLQSVRYSNEESLQLLLSNCPTLEDLSVNLREYGTTGKLTVVVQSLQSLSLYIPVEHDIQGFVIDTPSLKYLKLQDHIEKNHYCLIEIMPNLIEAYVDVFSPNIKSLLESITSVKRLSICSEAMYDEEFVFHQLEHLELCRCKEDSSNLLVKLLKDSPNLQVLDLFSMDGIFFLSRKPKWMK